ncbi:MAG TPA: [FeFe] hydrogenase H-cluster maturation GTPase HydF [Candidatus Omnitrophota bacterium]|nr:[FeFe] hydrogenase H-cluster maturation GTPase HydF [Candidatus Omnitrophota bacterium]HPS37673.1 [FeFe] hydrogenase H-cluster maturation GTPase HydF [Candidatus Omnitrophota bacterium]
MEKTPKSLRLQIGIFGRTNVGKSSFLNMVVGQDVAITSPVPGTTTDVVEKVMELLPVGPVVFLDTGGLDDASDLGARRIERTRKVFDRADVTVLILEAEQWTEFEEEVVREAEQRKSPLIFAVNKSDLRQPSQRFLEQLKARTARILVCASTDRPNRDRTVALLKQYLLEVCPEDFLTAPAMIGDLIPKGGLAVLIIPIDFEAPKGRIILPQVQAIRDALDHDSMTLVVKESEYREALSKLKNPPDLVVCDSQVVDRMVTATPKGVKCTTFSILLSRIKGDIAEMTRGAFAIGNLKPGNKVLIAESCSHHAIEGDIGRVKIPKWLREHLGHEVEIRTVAGRDFPDDVADYKLIIQCGSCMLTRRETLTRIQKAKQAGVPITNYGLCISYLHGVLGRVLEPFPDASEICSRTVSEPRSLKEVC